MQALAVISRSVRAAATASTQAPCSVALVPRRCASIGKLGKGGPAAAAAVPKPPLTQAKAKGHTPIIPPHAAAAYGPSTGGAAAAAAAPPAAAGANASTFAAVAAAALVAGAVGAGVGSLFFARGIFFSFSQ